MAPEISYVPASPEAGDGVFITVKGVVAEGAKVVISSDTKDLIKSPPFGQDAIPEGTGKEARSLQITGGTSGTFALTVVDPETAASDTTEPIYYYNDAPTYAYPDDETVREALEDVVPADVSVEVSRSGALLTILFGGRWSGKDVPMTVDTTLVGGSETGTAADVTIAGGPSTFGPYFLAAGDYDINVKAANDSVLAGPTELTVS